VANSQQSLVLAPLVLLCARLWRKERETNASLRDLRDQQITEIANTNGKDKHKLCC
jgi:hypothetical protein